MTNYIIDRSLLGLVQPLSVCYDPPKRVWVYGISTRSLRTKLGAYSRLPPNAYPSAYAVRYGFWPDRLVALQTNLGNRKMYGLWGMP